MDMQRFRELCDAYGADARRWPAADQTLHARFAGTPEGIVALAEAARLDSLLDEWRPRAGDLANSERILASIVEARPRRRTAGLLSTAFAACAVLGFALGYTQAPGQELDSETYASLLLGSSVMEDLP